MRRSGAKVFPSQSLDLHGDEQQGIADDPGPGRDVAADLDDSEVGNDRDDEENETDDLGDELGGVGLSCHEC